MGTHESEPPIQALAPPAPWVVSHNTLRAVEPDGLKLDDPWWGWFTQDLVVLDSPHGVVLDIGWYPDGSAAGRFRLCVFSGRRDPKAFESWETRSLANLVAKMNEVCGRLATELGPPPPPRTVPEIAAIVRSATDVRDAIDRVRDLGKHRATGELLDLLADSRAPVRSAVVDELYHVADPATGAALLARFVLPDPDLNTRRRLIRALGAVQCTEAIPILRQWLGNPDSEQRIASAWSLAALKAVEALDDLQHAYAVERRATVRPHLQRALQIVAYAFGEQQRSEQKR